MASASGTLTKQWAGHLRRLEHEANQERERRIRRGLDPSVKRTHKRKKASK